MNLDKYNAKLDKGDATLRQYMELDGFESSDPELAKNLTIWIDEIIPTGEEALMRSIYKHICNDVRESIGTNQEIYLALDKETGVTKIFTFNVEALESVHYDFYLDDEKGLLYIELNEEDLG